MALPRTASRGGQRAVAHDRARTKVRAGPIPATKVNARVHTSGRAEMSVFTHRRSCLRVPFGLSIVAGLGFFQPLGDLLDGDEVFWVEPVD